MVFTRAKRPTDERLERREKRLRFEIVASDLCNRNMDAVLERAGEKQMQLGPSRRCKVSEQHLLDQCMRKTQAARARGQQDLVALDFAQRIIEREGPTVGRHERTSTRNLGYQIEIDISETYSQYPDLAIPFLHYTANDNGGPIPGTNTAWNCTAQRGVYNTFALEWTATRLEIFVNGTSCLVNTSGDPAFKSYAGQLPGRGPRRRPDARYSPAAARWRRWSM